jgi:hypothetical protein
LIKADNIIRVLKAQYDKQKAFRNSNENQVFVAKLSKDSPKGNKPNKNKCASCKKKEHTKKQCWAKGGAQEAQGPNFM